MPNVTAEELDDFNPLPRKEGDCVPAAVCCPRCKISIHSLVKRETEKLLTPPNALAAISIHSLVKRETSIKMGVGIGL